MKSIRNTQIEKIRNNCIDCNLCVRNCLFLKKYNMNLKEFTRRKELCHNCFLCDKCLDVCPKDLSGRSLSIELRKNSHKKSKRAYFLKKNYIFKNTSNKKSKKLLFLGCNYPGFYPRTTSKLIEICERMNIDFSIDCCKKPILDEGISWEFHNMEKMLRDKETEELICTCPNCYHLLKKKLSIKVTNIYEFLKEENIGKKIEESTNVFFPCSDRYSREIFQSIKHYITNYKDSFHNINCCGLGGSANRYEKEILDKTKENLLSKNCENIYTYCSSCSGIFYNEYGIKNVKNFLSEILGINEKVSNVYLKNVISFKLLKRRD